MITCRLAEPADIERMTELRIAMQQQKMPHTEAENEALGREIRNYFSEAMRDGRFYSFVACDGETIVAMSGGTLYTLPPNFGCPTGKTVYISNMYTIPEYRRRGIASQLFQMTVQEAKRRGCGRFHLHATQMGRNIYAKFGFAGNPAAMTYYPDEEEDM